jgi:hypothetical protein
VLACLLSIQALILPVSPHEGRRKVLSTSCVQTDASPGRLVTKYD